MISSSFRDRVEIIPADDAVFDEPLAGFGHLLVFFRGLQEFPWVGHRDGAREAVYMLNPIQLLFDGLPQHGSSMAWRINSDFGICPNAFSPIEGVLFRVGVQPAEQI